MQQWCLSIRPRRIHHSYCGGAKSLQQARAEINRPEREDFFTLTVSLRNLVLLDSICGAVDDVAVYLQRTFPRLAHLRAIEWLQNADDKHLYPTQDLGKWVDVSSRMPSVEPWNVDFLSRHGTNFDGFK